MQGDTGPGLSPITTRLHNELLAVRKTSEGWTVATAGLYPTICAVLGGGDPHLAYSALRIAVLKLIDSPGMVAACASLGLTTDLPTHTDRLNDAGADLGLSERQVRRLSDQGLIALARFVATNWNQSAVPDLSLTLVRTSMTSADLAIGTCQLREVQMNDPIVSIGKLTIPSHGTFEMTDNHARRHVLAQVSLRDEVIDLGVRWTGELWPRFNVCIVGMWSKTSIATLGNRLGVSLVR